jgi:adenine-specific DNA-methyltransferase
MSDNTIENKKVLQGALKNFANAPLAKASTNLFSSLGYSSEKTTDLGGNAESFLSKIEQFKPELGVISRDKVKANQWKSCAFLFQLTNDEIPSLAIGLAPLGADTKIASNQIESFVYLAIELKGESWSRTDLASITREINRRFPMPAIVLFKHGELLSLAVIDRRQNLRDGARDVIDSRITVIKDVRIAKPHRAHLDILANLAIQNLGAKRRPSNFRELYDAWIETLSTQALNKRFYTDLAWWYFWAIKQVDFPAGGGLEANKRNSVAVIRLLTRLIFVWFIKEKKLVPEGLFERDNLKKLLQDDPGTNGEDSTFYLAILQNLFFATLNVEMGTDRKWATEGSGMKGDRLIHSLYRHKELFKNTEAALDLFSQIPFLNGGLFECLDRELTERDFQRNPELKQLAAKEGNGWVLRVDGFSRRAEAQPKVPNKIFFGGQDDADLNDDLGTKGKRYRVLGLLDIFAGYKFTVEENTPVEEEVALDPELLGKVFENLLASYNEDTQSTARKQSGSFYTPREVVDYMVDEALIAYFERHLEEADNREETLHRLLSYTTESNDFSVADTTKLIASIEQLKILDPACGSGAFPMGVLTKLVHVLRKLDPDNKLWTAQNIAPLQAQLTEAKKIPDPSLRETKIEEAEAALDKSRHDFANVKHADYTRKLYLIEKCIHGVDIQPIAVQIAKLRFFIALVVSQDVDKSKDNWGITALPNLETKIVAADSLTPIREVKGGMVETYQLGQDSIKGIEADLHDAGERYFSARTTKTKRKYRDVIQNLRDKLADELEQSGFSTEKAHQLVQWNPFDQNAAADFFDPEWMFQLADGFDITIGNPPYVRHEEIKHLKDKLKTHYDCFTGTADLYVYFYERSIKLLKPEGAFAFITSNKWYRAKYGEKLRDWMNGNTQLRKIIDFGDEAVFTAIAYPTIVIATRRKTQLKQPDTNDRVRALNWAQQHPVETFPAVFATDSFEVPQAELKKDGWQLEPPLKRQLLARLRTAGKPLGEYVNGRFYRGILTGFNEAFVIDGATRARLIADDPKSAEIIKPFLRGRDVKRWRVEFADQYLIKIESSENKPHPWSGKSETEAEKIFAKCYPAIHTHFQNYRQAMIDRYDQGKFFWELRACAYWQEFEQPKIVVPAITDAANYAPDEEGFYSNDKTSIVVSEEWRYLLAILNSSSSWWLTQQAFASRQGGFFEFKPMYVSQVPIPVATARQKQIMEALVNAVLATSNVHFEQLINGLVFELFFPDDLHRAKIQLFDAATKAGIGKLAALKNKALVTAADELAETIFATNHPIYGMLFDLQGLDVVRIIEGRE